ncbi:MAG TPA: hypothetical protein DDW84_01395 [Phycisphaerales bacterium]|nr:MAG: hypothetical protein A2Y13_01190 [Planctomycetes bacterium GWC2_45_44]HBG77491.1 hypothetical protein [Phycisphaerales bacterium]HBR19099.1 hypothetical protein [Phycisphaerales bacterium]
MTNNTETVVNPTLADTREFLAKVRGGHKPTDDEMADHCDNLKMIVAEKNGIATDDVDSFLRKAKTMRERMGIGGNKRKELCRCGSGRQHRKCCGKYSR